MNRSREHLLIVEAHADQHYSDMRIFAVGGGTVGPPASSTTNTWITIQIDERDRCVSPIPVVLWETHSKTLITPKGVTTTVMPNSGGGTTPTSGGSGSNTSGSSKPLDFFGLYMHYFSLDNLQTSLDVGGCTPIVGEPLDALNAGIHVCRGNWGQADLGGISMIPVFGDAIGKGGKISVFLFKKGDEIVGATAAAVKHLDELIAAIPTVLYRLRWIAD